MASIKDWVGAFRLRTLPLALSSIGMGGFLAAYKSAFDATIFTLCCLTTIFLQVLSNLANDYGDSIHGADSDKRLGPSRAVQTGKISPSQMKSGVIISGVLSLISGLGLLYFSFDVSTIRFWVFFVIGLLSIGAAINYTVGKNPYGYAGFGDIFVMIFFGWVGVGGTYYLQTTLISWEIMLPATTIGLFSTAVLNINNIRDIESDKEAGKNSIPVRLGAQKARIYHIALVFLAVACSVWFTQITYTNWTDVVYVASLPVLFIITRVVIVHFEPQKIDPQLKKMALFTFFYMLVFGAGLLF